MKNPALFISVFCILFAASWLYFGGYLNQDDGPDDTPDPSIASFQECVAAGYSIDDSYPERCSTPDGKRFVANLPASELANVTTPVSTSGTLTCLPHWDTSGPQTLECAIGLEGDDGNYYTLANLQAAASGPDTGDRVTLRGRLIPGSHKRYQSVGQIEIEEVTLWEAGSNEADIVTFQYPESLGKEYVTAVDWPPMVRLLNEPFSCSEAGDVAGRAGETQLRTIDEEDYCVTTRAEGAAGSTYMQYAYLTKQEGKTVSLTFSTRSPQCANFATDREREQCESDQHLDIDALVISIIQTLEVEQTD